MGVTPGVKKSVMLQCEDVFLLRASCQLARHVLSGMRGDVEVLMTACQEATLNQREQTDRAASSGGREEGGGG